MAQNLTQRWGMRNEGKRPRRERFDTGLQLYSQKKKKKKKKKKNTIKHVERFFWTFTLFDVFFFFV